MNIFGKDDVVGLEQPWRETIQTKARQIVVGIGKALG